jgi:hypothetical protein
MATYLVTRDSTTTALGGSQLTIDFSIKSISDQTFTVRGKPTNKDQIDATIKVVGAQSGEAVELSLQVAK